jgi:hypothetical protein
MFYRRTAVAVLIAGTLSCASGSTSNPPAPATPATGSGAASAPATSRPATPPPATTPPPQASGAAGAPGGPPGGGRGPGGSRPQLTPEQVAARRDTLNTMRTGVIADLMARMAGKENQRAGEVFTNVQLMNY